MLKHLSAWLNQRARSVLASLVLAAISAALFVAHWTPSQPPALRLSAGSAGTRRHQVTEYLAEQARHHGLHLQLQTSAGSEDCLKQIRAGRLDAGIVSSGVVIPDDQDIMVLAALQHEAVHVLLRPSLVRDAPLAQILRGQRVNVGVEGSTEHLLAGEFLKFVRMNGISNHADQRILLTHFTKPELIAKADAIVNADETARTDLVAELPDCLLVLDSMPSSIAQLYVAAAGYQLMPVVAARAFLNDTLQDSETDVTTLQREFLERVVIPAHSYYSDGCFPATDCETVGSRLLLVAHRNAPDDALRPLLEAVYEGEYSRRILPVSPRELATPYAIHPAAEAYLDRDKPLAWAAVVEWISKGFSFLGAFSAGALSLYGLLWRRKSRKPADYFAEIHRVDRLATAEISAQPASPEARAALRQLDEHLLRLRQELIEDICNGHIKGDQVIANILMLLRDTRRNLNSNLAGPATFGDAGPTVFRPELSRAA
ncbi:MAG: hypothetical protein K1X74_05195 [Pirellulales bacterium]|nr:hypothetical protein [Pirellulales bacterium]